MIRLHDINWYLQDPLRLVMMKPFTRGGKLVSHPYEGEGKNILNNTMIDTGFASLELSPISQDLYLTEYDPTLHHIILNKSIPHIKVVLDGHDLPFMELTQTASFQKLIHAAHVRNLTVNPLEFELCKDGDDDSVIKQFQVIKEEWKWRNRETDKYRAISTCKKVGNCGMLFSFDKTTNKYDVTNYSYQDGYQIVPNYDEYGNEIARSLVYQIDHDMVIDTYDANNHYRCYKNATSGNWDIKKEAHGFSICPLLHKRGKVAWEYAESSIEMWELMVNIQDIALKRFGTFALVLIGDMDTDSFKRDSSTLIINLSSDNTNGKQDAKTLNFPEPQTMDAYLQTLENKISLFSSTTFITPKDITRTGSGGNGIALAMSNDYALATQSSIDWQGFVNDMVKLHQEGLDLETGGSEGFAKLHISPKITPWSLETNNTKINNLSMEAQWLSTRTIVERSPDAASDEVERIIQERGALMPNNTAKIGNNAETAQSIMSSNSLVSSGQ